MSTRIKNTLSAALLLLLLPLTVYPNPTRYTVMNEIPNLHINTFVQDHAGYMWIGTAKGLCRYNGYEYFCYNFDPSDQNSLPSDHITSLYIDSQDCMWIGTDKGLCTYSPCSDNFERYYYQNDLFKTSSEFQCLEVGGEIYVCGVFGIKKAVRETRELMAVGNTESYFMTSLLEDDFSQLWISSLHGQGIWFLEKEAAEAVCVYSAPDKYFYCSYKTPSGEIWFGSNSGITAFNPITRKSVPCAIETDYPEVAGNLNIKFITGLDGSRIMIGTENCGGFIYNFANGVLSPFDETDFIVEVNSVHFTSCYVDNAGNKWIGTFDKGYFMEPNRDARFNTDKRFNLIFSDMFVTRIAEDREGNFWIGTRYNGIIYFDNSTFGTYIYDSGNFAPLRTSGNNLIENLYIDSRGDLWIGTVRALIKCRSVNGRITDYRYVNNVSPSVIKEDSHGNIWVGSSLDNMLFIPDGKTENIVNISLPNKWNNITSIDEGNDGTIYFSMYDDGIYFTDPSTLEISKLYAEEHMQRKLERVIHLYIDSRNILWGGTYGEGLVKYDIDGNTYSYYDRSNGLSDKNAVAVVEDYHGNIWTSTSYGLCKLDMSTENISVFYNDDGIGGNQFHEKAVLRSLNGKIYFGGNHGLTYFDSRDITNRTHDIPVTLEDLKVMNISEDIGRPGGVLSSHISRQEGIALTHKHTTFSLDFTGIDFGSSKKIRYAYRLHPFDRDWNYVSDYRRATYSNLSPGKYTFEVMARNHNGQWSENPTRLDIRVLPSPWLSGWMLTVYIIITLAMLWALIYIYVKIKLNNEKLMLAERENEYQKEMTSMKIRFFTNISHELRTPLTMIYGPVKKLLNGDQDDEAKNYLLNLLNFNVNKLLELIDQLMDFARLENDTLALSVSPADPAALAKNIVNSYTFFAKEKSVSLTLETGEMPDRSFVDADKLSKILSNLISNAVKYTPDGGHITVYICKEVLPGGNYLKIEVVDDGIGMKEEDFVHLFKRFKRFGSKDDYSKKPGGKGIGLNYVKRLVDIHKGSIRARLNDTKGMTFTVHLPVDKEFFDKNQITEIISEYQKPEEIGETNNQPADGSADAGTEKPHKDSASILVVEDDMELNKFITSMLKEDYNVLNAYDGIEGLELCRTADIDLVVSDVLMPRMNGYDFCKTVKEDPELCHLVFIMLTAKTLEENQLDGYKQGADYYITKPFNPDILGRVIKNTLQGMEMRKAYLLRNLGKTDTDSSGPENYSEGAPAITPLDKRFIEKLYACIEGDLTNTGLNINELSGRMALSRTSFYRKVKALTGLSPNELLKVYRLEKAVQLLETGQYTISEIVDLTGFGTHSHFSTTFKKHFGINPKRYKGRGAGNV